jgi:hypothetical protein
MAGTLLTLTRLKLLTTFIRSRPMLFWGVVWPVLWVFIGVTVFKSPTGVPTAFYYGAQIAFLLQIAFSTLCVSGALEASLDSIRLPYLVRFTKVNSRSYVGALLLSYFLFAVVQSAILVAISPPVFGISYATVGLVLPAIFLLALVSATLYLEMGIIISYLLLLLRLPRLTQVASFIPWILMYITVIGQVVGSFTGNLLTYIPFNELYTLSVISMANVAGPSYVDYALNSFHISGVSLTFMSVLLPIWILVLALAALSLVAIYNRSGIRGRYQAEDIIGG